MAKERNTLQKLVKSFQKAAGNKNKTKKKATKDTATRSATRSGHGGGGSKISTTSKRNSSPQQTNRSRGSVKPVNRSTSHGAPTKTQAGTQVNRSTRSTTPTTSEETKKNNRIEPTRINSGAFKVNSRTKRLSEGVGRNKTMQTESSSVVKRGSGAYLDTLASAVKHSMDINRRGAEYTRAEGSVAPGKRKVKETDTLKTIENKGSAVTKRMENTAARLQDQGQKEYQNAKEMVVTPNKEHQKRLDKEGIMGMSVGDVITNKRVKEKGFDVLDQAAQMGMDIAITGGRGTLAAMGARAFGAEKREAINAGANESQAEVSAAGNAAVEILTEKMFGANKVLKSVMGKGAADGLTDAMIRKFVGKLTGQNAKTFTELVMSNSMGALEEGLEELVAEGLQPRIANLVYANGLSEQHKQNANAVLDNAVQNGANPNTVDRLKAAIDNGESVESVKKTLGTLVAGGMDQNEARKVLESYMESQNVIRNSDYLNAFGMGAALGALGGVAGGAAEYGSARVAEKSLAQMFPDSTTGGQREIIEQAKKVDDAKAANEAAALSDEFDKTGSVSSLALDRMVNAVEQQKAADDQRVSSARVAAGKQLDKENLTDPYGVNEDGELTLGRAASQAAEEGENIARKIMDASVFQGEMKAGNEDDIAQAVGAFYAGTIDSAQADTFSYENTEARAVLEQAIGEELPIVTDRRGNINIPETNAATKDFIFSKVADNIVNVAKSETETQKANVIADIQFSASKSMGAKGQAAYNRSARSFDESTPASVRSDAHAFQLYYQAGRSGNVSYEEIEGMKNPVLSRLNPEARRMAYEAGQEDAVIAQNEAKAKSGKVDKIRTSDGSEVRIQPQRGMLFDEVNEGEELSIEPVEKKMFRQLAESMNINIHLVSADNEMLGGKTDKDGKKHNGGNGAYLPSGDVYLNVTKGATDRAVEFVLMHEMTHHIRTYAPEAYAELENLVRSSWTDYALEGEYKGIGTLEDAISYIQDKYKNSAGQELSEDDALEEIIADATYGMMRDKSFINKACEQEPALGQAIVNAIKDMIRKIIDTLAMTTKMPEHQYQILLDRLGILEEAEDLWLNALSDAKLNSAAVGKLRSGDKLSLPENMAVLSSERIDSLIEEYATSSETSNYSKAYITSIDPADFLKLTIDSDELAKWTDGSVNGWGQEVRDLDVDALKNSRIMPYLTIDSTGEDGNRVVGHEGRHRMLALMKAGYKNVPVVIRDLSEATKTTKNIEDSIDLWSQDYGDGPVNANPLVGDMFVEVFDAIPINNKNKAEIERMYGGESKVRFSLSESEIQERDEHIRVLEQDAEESYGEPYTEDFNETGYILSNAKLLKMGDYGERMEDHNTILQLYDDISYATSQSPKADAMSRFLNEGHIRIMPETNSLEFGTRAEPTYQQYDQIWAYADSYGVDTIEFTDPDGKTVAYREYDSNPGGRRLYDDIKAFYRNGSLTTARFSVKETEQLDAMGIAVTESGSLVRYSLNSWEDTDVKALEKMLVEAGYEGSEVKKWIKNVNSVAAKILQDPERLNYTADENQKALKDNEEYYYTLDLSTLCAKRRLYQGTYNAVMHRLPNRPMMPEDTIRLRRMMADMGYEVPCGICYEESRKKNEGKFAERWQKKYREENPDAYIPNLDEVTTTDGRDKLKKEHPEVLESYLKYQRTRGSANPKVSFTHTDYRGDILKMTKGDVAKVKHIGGLRIQSFSDFEVPHVIDMMQAVMDMATMKLTSQAYTKVPAFANIFGGTGIKINLSLIGKVNAKGRLEFDAVEGIDPKEAFKLRKKYSENVGTIIVGADDASILAAWADPRIDMVIPFHRSGWAISEFKALGLGDYQDYTDYQSERYLDGTPNGMALGKVKKAGFIDSDEMFYSIDYWDYSKSGKENAEKYLELCAKNKRRPVFYNFLKDNGDGSWSLQPDGSTDGYWKSLVDFKMYNNEGVGAPQQEVKPVFDMRAANKVLAEYEGGADTLPVAQDVVDKFVEEAGAKFSIPESMEAEYQEAYKKGDTEAAKELVREAAEMAGYNDEAYHGTSSKFTTFSEDVGIHFFSSDPEVAYGYNSIGENPMHVYLNLGRTKLIDAEGNDWDTIPGENLDEDDLVDSVKITKSDNGYDVTATFGDGSGKSASVNSLDWMDISDALHNVFEIEWGTDDIADAIVNEMEGNSEMTFDSEWLEEAGYEQSATTDKLARSAKKKGYDSLVIENVIEGSDMTAATDFIVFNSNLIKSADPFVFDDAGELVTLSKRFNPSNNDVRYSITDKDSDGNQITQGQREYFKDSKAADGQGNLLKLYHGTASGGFTEFNLDGDRVIWMTSNIDAANAYGGTIEKFDPNEYQRKASETYSVDKKYRLNNYMVFDSEEELEKFKDEHKAALHFLDNPQDYDSLSDEELEMLEEVGVRDEDEYDEYINEGLYDDLLNDYRKYERGVIRLVPVIDLVNNPDKYDVSDYLRVVMDREDVLGWGDLTEDYNLDDPNAKYELIDYFKSLAEESGESVEEFWNYSAPVRVPEGMTVSALKPSDRNLRYELYANLLNPYVIEFGGARYDESFYEEVNYARDHKGEYDGVIVRNVEVGPMGIGTGDVVIAFNSDQVKLVDNLDPTINPDIRFSVQVGEDWIVENEDEVGEVAPVNKRIAESRARREDTKAEIIARADELRKDTRLTQGKVVDTKSIERPIRELIMDAMANSETTKKYKQSMVKKAVEASKLMFTKFAENKMTEAADIAYDTALEIMEDLTLVDDNLWTDYRDMRNNIRNTPVALSDQDKSDIPDFNEWRKANFGRIRISNEGEPVDVFYAELSADYPEWFPADITHPADQVMQIANVLDSLKPYEYAYTSEEADALASDIAIDLLNITYQGSEWKSYADRTKERYDERTKRLKAKHKAAEMELRRKHQNDINNLKEKNRERLKKARGDRDAKIAYLKKRYAEKKAQQKSAKERAKSFGHIKSNYDWLTSRLVKPTDAKHIPEGFRKALANVLQQLDLQTERSKALEEKYGKAQSTMRMDALRRELGKIANEEGTGPLEYDGYVFQVMDALAERVDGVPVDRLTNEDLRDIDLILTSIRHNIQNINKAFSDGINARISELAEKTITTAKEKAANSGARSNWSGIVGAIDNLLNESTVTPRDFFELIGGGLNDVFVDGLRAGMDVHVRDIAQMREMFGEMFSKYNKKGKPGSVVEGWRDSTHVQTFTLEDGQTIRMNPAQIMSLYCAIKRPQAAGHIFGSGIAVTEIDPMSQTSNLFEKGTSWAKKMVGQKLPKNGAAQRITAADAQQIISALDAEQLNMAQQLHRILYETCADWGNEVSLKMYGYKKFTEDNYFPIQSADNYLDSNYSNRQTVESIKNFGFTKGTVVNANNPVVIDDIFTVVADHVNKMSLYRAFAAPISDFTRVMNCKVRDDEGLLVESVKSVVEDAYGKKALTYIKNFLADVQTQQQTRQDGMLKLINKSLANVKKANIAGNLRVALQQPTAIIRALAVMSPKYFTVATNPKQNITEMIEYCPIAAWKSWGHNQVDMARGIDAIMMNQEWTRLDAVTMKLYGSLDNLTWSYIWAAVKNEIRAKNPSVQIGSQEYWDLCNKRASEVFDKTQVVDSVFHRSQGMRSTDIMSKMMTSFMSEPTRTYNMIRTDLVMARELANAGEGKAARNKLARATTVFLLNAATVSAAAAVADAIRDQFTGDDDDKEYESLIDAWFKSTIENFKDNANVIKMIPYLKDVWDLMFDTWGTSNMAFEGWESLGKANRNLLKALTGEGKKSTGECVFDMLKAIGQLTGVPVKNVARELESFGNMFGITWKPFAAEVGEEPTSEPIKELGYSEMSDEVVDKGGSYASEDNLIERLTYKLNIKDGSRLENWLNKHGYHLTDEEKAKVVQNERLEKIKEAIKDQPITSSEDLDKAIWKEVTNQSGVYDGVLYADGSKVSMTNAVARIDTKTIDEMRDLFVLSGGSKNYFEQQVVNKMGAEYKKTIGINERANWDRQDKIKDYLINKMGVSGDEISHKLIAGHGGGSKCNTAKAFQKAFAEGDMETAQTLLSSMVDAGITYGDFQWLCDNAYRTVKASDYATGEFEWPLEGGAGTLTSHFGRRSSPTAGASSNHPAIDIGVARGTHVTAADGGKVIFVGRYGGYGNQVGIDHGNGYISYYSHLDGFNVQKGQVVKKGQVVAYSGNTGVSTGPHLDFKILENGSPVDPEKFLKK